MLRLSVATLLAMALSLPSAMAKEVKSTFQVLPLWHA